MAGPTEQALDQIWARYSASWKRLLSPGMLRELALRASFDVDLVPARDIANKIPAGTVPDCDACEDLCCVGLENVVSLRLSDVAVLMDIGRTELMTKKKPNFPESMLRHRPGIYEVVGSELWRTLPVLRQIGESRICAALTQDLKCSLYPNWPKSCQRFPYTLSPKKKQVSWGTRCKSKSLVTDEEKIARSRELFQATIDAYNERVKDAVLLVHARRELDAIGIGAWLIGEDENPFEPRPKGSRLKIVE